MRRSLSLSGMLQLLFAMILLPVLAASAAPVNRAVSEEEYQVYKGFLNSPFVEKGDYALYEKLGIYFIYNIRNESAEEVSRFFKTRVGLTLHPELVNNFVTYNKSPKQIDRKQFSKNTRFSAQFIQKNVYSFSRVGFSPNQDEALFYASFSSLMEDGHGSLIYLQKTSGIWSVVKAAAVWMYGASVHPFNP